MWERTGGGCHTSAGGSELMKYPCDDDWENKETRERVKIRSTLDSHYSLPDTVDSLEEVYELEVVRPRDE